MKKNGGLFMALLVAMLVILSACGPQPTAEPPATQTPTTAPTQLPATAAPTATVPTGPVTINTPEAPGECVSSALPLRPLDDTDWVKGASADQAKITIVEYSDFQCPGCSGMYPLVEELLKAHPEVQFAYRHFPLTSIHDKAFRAAEAAEAAGAQGKFWEMYALLFQNQADWTSLSAEEFDKKLEEYAGQLSLDVSQFKQALTEGAFKDKVQQSYDEAVQIGLPGTPSFIFDGVVYQGGLSYDGLEGFITTVQQLKSLQFAEPPETTLNVNKSYQATLQTSKGKIVIKLFPQSAPTQVNNFIFLAKNKWYDGGNFFFVQPNYVAVTGDPTNTGAGDPGYYCSGETNSVFDRPGLVGITAGGQFFITLGTDANALSGRLALIGQVTEGLEVAQSLATQAMESGDPPADVLQSVTVTEQ